MPKKKLKGKELSKIFSEIQKKNLMMLSCLYLVVSTILEATIVIHKLTINFLVAIIV